MSIRLSLNGSLLQISSLSIVEIISGVYTKAIIIIIIDFNVGEYWQNIYFDLREKAIIILVIVRCRD